ncbi:flavin reductase family protein [Mesorhizobium sp. M1406]|uniref:flavin reductase family protein n=1 Tax=Mesorhizobium sp. M1406 TaxID=2957099 RepID=UPI003337E181
MRRRDKGHGGALLRGALTDADLRHAGAAIVNFDCEIETVHVVGTHNVMIGRVIDVRHGSGGSALLYVDRNYTQPTRLGSFGG